MGGSLPCERVDALSGAATHPWYALRVRGRHEKTVASFLEEKGLEPFVPFYRCRKRWSDRIREVELPLFPGYLFCRFDINRRLPILTTPGVLDVVGFGKAFIPVDDVEMGHLQKVVASHSQAEPWPWLEVGQRVRIDRGPLSGVEGLLVGIKSSARLVLSVTLLQRSVAVEVEESSVRPVERDTNVARQFVQ
jgi:transcription antitermination factor NusG